MDDSMLKKGYNKARASSGKAKPKVDAMMSKGKKGAKRPAGKS